jgi:hypothetical protein
MTDTYLMHCDSGKIKDSSKIGCNEGEIVPACVLGLVLLSSIPFPRPLPSG